MLAPLLAHLGVAPTVSPADQATLLAAWHGREAAAGEWLTLPNAVCEELFFIEQGVLRLVDPGAGREITHSFRSTGQFCTVLASFERRLATPLRIQAVCATRVLAISPGRLASLQQQLPFLTELLHQRLRQELLDKLTLQRAYLGLSAAARYRLLVARQPEVARCAPQWVLASYLGITPQSLSRLRRMEV